MPTIFKHHFIFPLLLLLIVLAICLMVYHTYFNQPKSSPTLITVKPYQSASFTAMEQPKSFYELRYHSSYGYIDHIYVKNQQLIQKQTPLLTYYNPQLEPLILAQKKLLTQINHSNVSNTFKDQARLKFISDIAVEQNHLVTRLTSPIKGYVLINNTTPSKENDIILTITSEEHIIVGDLPETFRNKFKIDEEVTLLTSNNQQFYGKINSISPIPKAYHTKNSVYRVIIKSDKNCPLGTHIKVAPYHTTFELPQSVLIQKDCVLISKNNKLIKREVKYTKSSKKGYIIITQGLNINDRVVRHPEAKDIYD
ncbi:MULTISPECIES: HlyD family efflux transporter periplasmic adaptor subunit [Staphylococcus]|nr:MULTISPECIES: HlyD family efflux transporter periplasmic adaptor subunit [Staphylococcus]MCH8665747.1 HlyD family efflux transporter periplasmic adaptor subunit [Staphylococcus lugdunensis]